jgi:preprotein translocase subunit SecA
MFEFLKKIFGTAQDRLLKRYWKIVTQINQWDEKFQSLDDNALKAKTTEFRQRLQQGENIDQILPEAYAVVKNVCRRLMGTEVHVSGYDQKWDMIPYDVQLVGAIAMHHGSISEMQTGEGKTLTAVLALYLNALTGKPVHLVTVNDYLASRDCQWVGSILRWLGLTTAALTSGAPMDQRKAIYNADVVYGTASEFGFDYLRDNSLAQRKEDQVQRGFYYAIVDEIDSILVDEARTPLIISGPVPVSRQMYDTLKGDVDELVRRQRDLCNRLATESRRVLESPKESVREADREEALRKLWLVSKGTPRNKILKRMKEDPEIRAELDKLDLFYYGDSNKQEKAQALSELLIILEERSNEYEMTDRGIAAWQDITGKSDDFVMFDISHEFLQIDSDPTLNEETKAQRRLDIQEEDAKRKERVHNMRQLLRGHLLMERDVDYIVQDNKIVIIDENTGRPQPGRRFSDGLHQAIEAKEGVAIQKETQTYATITLQNFFRMYEKLSGMTGTASTEAGEFKEIYKLDVLQIPTHKPGARKDFNDEVYMTEREKYNAILKEVKEIHAQGRPILIGTESVEVSEKLSRIFRQNKLDHVVLNAKQHDREAEIVAQAGKRGAITISTNMAGRGTDIKLEPGVAQIGGLFVLGTTRHQSRRIDRQLRGRCARQGDPGNSKFFISFEDSLLRLFASPTLNSILQKFRPPEGEPISARILNRSIETAQKRVEQRNFLMRKHTLEYDLVMNRQRQEIYAFRNEVLHTDNIIAIADELLENVTTTGAAQFFRSRSEEGSWNPEGFRTWLINHFPVSFEEDAFDLEYADISELEKIASDKITHAFHEKVEREKSKIKPANTDDTKRPNPVDNAIRNLIIREIDHLWQEHLLTMDHLRTEVNLRTVGQRDPLTEFKHEAFTLFGELTNNLRTKIGQSLFRFEMVPMDTMQLQRLLSQMHMETTRSFLNDLEEPSKIEEKEPDSGRSPQEPPKGQPIQSLPQIGRNDPCPCGSGKKYKKCCGQHLDGAEPERREVLN